MIDPVQFTVEAIRSNPHAPEDEILQKLRDSGIGANAAIQLATLVPIAYGRIGLRTTGAKFPPNYIWVDVAGDPRREGNLTELPWWNEAIACAKREQAGPGSVDEFLAVAGRSPEVRIANNAMRDGRNIDRLVFSPVILMWEEFPLSSRSESPGRGSRPWWKFWQD
jgi:hypothetical protein